MKDNKEHVIMPAAAGERALSALAVGERAVVSRLDIEGPMRRRFLDLGLLPGASVRCMGKSPAGDPAAYLIKGALIAIRAKDAASVKIAPPEPDSALPDEYERSDP